MTERPKLFFVTVLFVALCGCSSAISQPSSEEPPISVAPATASGPAPAQAPSTHPQATPAPASIAAPSPSTPTSTAPLPSQTPASVGGSTAAPGPTGINGAIQPEAFEITLINTYDNLLDLGPIAQMARQGTDSVAGVLSYDASDGKYHGIVDARVENARASGTAFTGESCDDVYNATQQLSVVGELVSVDDIFDPPDPAQQPISQGTFADDLLFLHFTGIGKPNHTPTKCQGDIEDYLDFLDSRWSFMHEDEPNVGLFIRVPVTGKLVYRDVTDVRPDLNVDSTWDITVTAY